MNLKRFSLGKEKEMKSYSMATHNKEPSNTKSSKIDGGECNITIEFNLGRTIPVFEYRKDNYLFKMMFNLDPSYEKARLVFSTNIVENEDVVFTLNREPVICDLINIDSYVKQLHSTLPLVSKWNENEIFNLLLYGYMCIAFSKSGMFSAIDDIEWCKIYIYMEDFIAKSMQCYRVETKFKFDFAVINNALEFFEVTEDIDLDKVAMPLQLRNGWGATIISHGLWVSLVNHCIYILDNNLKIHCFRFGDISLSNNMCSIMDTIYNFIYLTVFNFKGYIPIDLEVNWYSLLGASGYKSKGKSLRQDNHDSKLIVSYEFDFYDYFEELFKNSVTQLLGNKVKDMLGFKQS